MEKTRVEVKSYRSYAELFYGWAALGLGAVLLAIVLGGTVLRKHP
jgi:hypothetical protein